MCRIMTIALIAGSILYAQPPQSPVVSGGDVTPPTPAQMAQHETDRLTQFFQLTPPQQTAVLGILTTANTQVQPLTAQIKPLRGTLTAAIKSNNQGLISSTLQQLSNLQEQKQLIRAKVAGQIYATVLTSAQQAQVGTGLGPLMREGPGRGGFGGRR
jgi:Spy/CpxP family protein refolding chaperone